MAKSVADAVLDAALQYLEDNATLLCVCSAQPTTYAEATSTYKLADVVIDSADFTGPADGDSSGRKTRINEQAAVPVDSSGDATHIALCKSSGSVLLYVTTCTTQTLTAGNTVTVPAWDIEIADPS